MVYSESLTHINQIKIIHLLLRWSVFGIAGKREVPRDKQQTLDKESDSFLSLESSTVWFSLIWTIEALWSVSDSNIKALILQNIDKTLLNCQTNQKQSFYYEWFFRTETMKSKYKHSIECLNCRLCKVKLYNNPKKLSNNFVTF